MFVKKRPGYTYLSRKQGFLVEDQHILVEEIAFWSGVEHGIDLGHVETDSSFLISWFPHEYGTIETKHPVCLTPAGMKAATILWGAPQYLHSSASCAFQNLRRSEILGEQKISWDDSA